MLWKDEFVVSLELVLRRLHWTAGGVQSVRCVVRLDVFKHRFIHDSAPLAWPNSFYAYVPYMLSLTLFLKLRTILQTHASRGIDGVLRI
jgi:hypothetical protein